MNICRHQIFNMSVYVLLSCSKVSTRVCKFITCEDNPMFRCQSKVRNKEQVCACPSCDAARDKSWCLKTRLVQLNIKSLNLSTYFALVFFVIVVWNRRGTPPVCMTLDPGSVAVLNVLTGRIRSGV